jgi:hypothetical protein
MVIGPLKGIGAIFPITQTSKKARQNARNIAADYVCLTLMKQRHGRSL